MQIECNDKVSQIEEQAEKDKKEIIDKYESSIDKMQIDFKK